MANEYGGAQLQSGITSAGNSIAEAIRRMGIEHKQQKDKLDALQGLLDTAKTIQTSDPKTGKAKPFFSEDQIGAVQQALDQHNAALAGGRAAALGIGKDVLQRAAKANAAAANAANPIVYRDGRRYLASPSGKLTPDTAVPRNAQTGQTAGQQFRQGLQLSAAQQRTMAAAQKGTAEMMKSHGITTTDLFDPSRVTPGTVDKGQFVAHTGQPIPATADKYPGMNTDQLPPQNAADIIFGGATTPGEPSKPEGAPTHVQVGAVAPLFVQTPDGKYKVADKGKPGALLTNEQFQAFQDQAAKLDPSGQGTEALQWLRNPENVKQDPALAAQVHQKLADSIAKGSAYTVAPSTSVDVESGNSGPAQAAGDETADTTDNEEP